MKINSQIKKAVVTLLAVATLFMGIGSGNSADFCRTRSGIDGQVFIKYFPYETLYPFPDTPLLIYEEKFYGHKGLYRTFLLYHLTATTDATFQVNLPPGTYVIAPDPISVLYDLGGFLPVTVNVQADRYAPVTIIVYGDDIYF